MSDEQQNNGAQSDEMPDNVTPIMAEGTPETGPGGVPIVRFGPGDQIPCLPILVDRREIVGARAHIFAVYSFDMQSPAGSRLVEPNPNGPIPVRFEIAVDTGRISLQMPRNRNGSR